MTLWIHDDALDGSIATGRRKPKPKGKPMGATPITVRIERKGRPSWVEIKAPAVNFDESEHPRDRHGLFIRIGARVRLWGGTGNGTVKRNLGGGRIEVLRDADNRLISVHQNYMDVLDANATSDARKSPAVPVEAPSPGTVDVHDGVDDVAKPVYSGPVGESDSPAIRDAAVPSNLNFRKTTSGAYRADGDGTSYTIYKDQGSWLLQFYDQDTSVEDLVLIGQMREFREYADRLGDAKMIAQHYEALGNNYEQVGGKGRKTEAVQSAYDEIIARDSGPQAASDPTDAAIGELSLFDDPPEAAIAADDAGRAAAGKGDPDPAPENGDVYTPPLDFDLSTYDFGLAVASIDKANRRAERAGIPHRFTFTTETYERTVTTDKRTGEVLPVPLVEERVKMTLNRPTIAHDGWRFAATLTWDPEAGLVTRMAGDGAVLRDRPEARKCDICKSVRDRKDTYIVQRGSGANMEELQVGSNCLTQFMGIKPEGLWMLGFEPDTGTGDGEEGDNGGGSGGESRWPSQQVLALALAVASNRGWVSRARAGDSVGGATADHLLAILHGRLERGGNSPQSQADAAAENAWRADMAASIPQWMDDASGLLDFARTFEGDSEYAANMRAIAGAESVSERNLPLLASSVASMIARKERVNRDAALANSVHIGAEGDKIKDVQARVTMVRPIEGNYGTTYLYTLVTTDGNVVKWFASSEQDVEVDDDVTVSGTIKKDGKGHGEFRGVKETNITRAKLARTGESAKRAQERDAAREAAYEAAQAEQRREYEQARMPVPEGFTKWDGTADLPVGTKVRVQSRAGTYANGFEEARILSGVVEGAQGEQFVTIYAPGGSSDAEMVIGYAVRTVPLSDVTAIAPGEDQNLAAWRKRNPDPEAVIRVPEGFLPAPSPAYTPGQNDPTDLFTIETVLAEGREVRLSYQGRYVNGVLTFRSPGTTNPTLRVEVPGVGPVQATLGYGGAQVVAVRRPVPAA